MTSLAAAGCQRLVQGLSYRWSSPGDHAVGRRYNYKLPRYNQMMNALTWMSHAQNLKRVAREHVIDLYLRPPVTRFRLMDYHFMDRIVRDANRCEPCIFKLRFCGGKSGPDAPELRPLPHCFCSWSVP